MDILFASSNIGKISEMKSVCSGSGINIKAAQELMLGIPPDVDEVGITYEENSLLKATAFFNWSGIPSLADDTGLEVFALNNTPGVFSARYAGEPTNMQNNIKKLLKNLDGVDDRRAKFITVLCLYIKDQKPRFFRGELNGEILLENRGTGGFGYDSIFYVPEISATLAEFKGGPETLFKTHRGRAVSELLKWAKEGLLSLE